MSITSVEGAVEQILKGTSDLTDIVGQQIYANIADQRIESSEDPYIVIITDQVDDVQTQDGVSGGDMVVYIDVYHKNLIKANSITDTIKPVLQDYSGTHGSIEIQEMWMTDKLMARSETVDKQIYRMEFMAMINYT